MVDIELVIKIPNSLYANLSKITNGSIASKRILDCVKNGTPLPKGHGRLVDADEIDNNIYDLTRSMDLDYGQISNILEDAPTIIEADKGE